MSELAQKGFEFKTHMAVVEGDAYQYLLKKYPQMVEGLKSLAEAQAEAPPKPKKAKSSKMITSRTVAKKKSAASAAEEATPSDGPRVEIVKQESGETVEQKVMAGGIIRRRRVDPSEIPAAAPATESPKVQTEAATAPVVRRKKTEATEESAEVKQDALASQEESVAAPALEETKIEESASTETTSFAEPELPETPPSLPAEPEVASPVVPEEPKTTVEKEPSISVEAKTVTPVEKKRDVVVERPVPPPTPRGRNLSAAPRLKVVEQQKPNFAGPKIVGTAPLPPRVEAKPKARPATGDDEAEDRLAAAAAKAAAEKKAAAKNWEAPKVTKRQLLGMTEEFEISRPSQRKHRKAVVRVEKKTKVTTPGAAKRKIRIESEIRVADLADRMGIKAADVVRKLIAMGQMVSAHQMIDFDTAVLIASEYEYEVENVAQTAESVLESYIQGLGQAGEKLSRPPVVTIMGHVDHGKTSLLDSIRKTEVASGEAGGITQHIGAYQIHRGEKAITFLDTPGHQAFTKMRARGAAVTDLVILVVAADEGIKAQTLEAIAHAKAAEVPIIVAVNKIDKPEAQPDRVMQELSGHELVPEEWGGDTMFVKVSAKAGTGIDDLLEAILLQAEVLDLMAVQEGPARGVILESRLDRGKGSVATVLVTSGTLKTGDPIVAGSSFGRVRALFNDRGQMVKEAGPSTPVEILGLASVPDAGEPLASVEDEAVAKRMADLSAAKKAHEAHRAGRVSLEDMYKKMQTGDIHELRVVLKGDVQGSIEAIADALEKIKHDEVKVQIIYKGAGGITESDVSLATASGAIILGFNVRPAGQAKTLAAQESVQIKTYSVIYELIDEVKRAMQGLLDPDIKENSLGTVEVRDVFNLSKFGIIAGCFVKSGKVTRGAGARLVRDSVVIYDTKIQSLRRFKEDAKEVAEGFECGLKLENFTDIKVGDIIEVYEKVEVAKAVM